MSGMGIIGRLGSMLRQEGRFGPQGVEWCHGESSGFVSVMPNGEGGTEVRVQCSECNEGKWEVTHYECAKCGFDRYGTTCVKMPENGYRVTFSCLECGHDEQHLQWEN
jgi:ribosomal protein L37E